VAVESCVSELFWLDICLLNLLMIAACSSLGLAVSEPRFGFEKTLKASRIKTLLGRFLVMAVAVVGSSSCHEPTTPPTELFQRAEELLQLGDYDGASSNYEAFLERFPNSPLAPIAEQRLRNIDRELEAVMGRRSTPAPIYIRPSEPVEEESETGDQESSWGSSER